MHNSKTFELNKIGIRKRRSKSDDYVWILKGLDLNVYTGERLALVGDSGSGKTTLLRLMADLELPTEGEILFDGKSICDYNPREYRRSVGFVSQTPSLFDGDVENNLKFAFDTAGIQFYREKCESLLLQVGLDAKLLGAKSDTLSVGQAQRVSIARALATAPSVLLMDEPTSALDPRASNAIVQLVGNLTRNMNMTAVLVLHDLAFARRGTDRIALLADGKIDSCTPTEGFFREPPTELARRFVSGEPTDNVDG